MSLSGAHPVSLDITSYTNSEWLVAGYFGNSSDLMIEPDEPGVIYSGEWADGGVSDVRWVEEAEIFGWISYEAAKQSKTSEELWNGYISRYHQHTIGETFKRMKAGAAAVEAAAAAAEVAAEAEAEAATEVAAGEGAAARAPAAEEEVASPAAARAPAVARTQAPPATAAHGSPAKSGSPGKRPQREGERAGGSSPGSGSASGSSSPRKRHKGTGGGGRGEGGGNGAGARGFARGR